MKEWSGAGWLYLPGSDDPLHCFIDLFYFQRCWKSLRLISAKGGTS